MIRGPVSLTTSEAGTLRIWGGAELVAWAARAAIDAAAAPVRAAWGRFAALSGTLRSPDHLTPCPGTRPAVFTRPRLTLRRLLRSQLPGTGADDDPAIPALATALGALVIDP